MEIKVAYFKKYGKLPGLMFDDFVPKNLYDGFKIPSSELLDWLKERGKNLKLTNEWEDMDSEAHDKAFTVAKVMTADILQTIFDSVLKAKAEGWTLKQFQDNLLPELEEKGWAGATPHRLKVIYDTNMRMAQAKGKYRKQKSVSAIYPFWVYKQIERKNKRHDHSKWNNRKFRHDDPIWDIIYPPSDFGCGCTVTPVKDGAGVENGEDILDELANSDEYKLSPLKAWKPDTSKYVSELKSKLEQILNSANQVRKKDDVIIGYNNSLPDCDWISFSKNKFSLRGSCVPKKNDLKTWEDYGLISAADLPDNDRLDLPELLPKGKDIADAVNILKNALGFGDNSKITVNTKIGDILISQRNLKHIVNKRNEAREIFGNFILPTLTTPFEIYDVEYQDNSFRKHFIALFKGKFDILCIVRINEDQTLYLRTFIVKDINNINEKRIGELLYSKNKAAD
ncbi:MAG: hypothetical protein KIT33_15155 [Candidatus Kapabacteria bacterium]|nr:hypothetical protein [Ignavibacteriota bacterium]MCW5886307.1 hypothetical protein [Candidatus Kapabacteria bacterium]